MIWDFIVFVAIVCLSVTVANLATDINHLTAQNAALWITIRRMTKEQCKGCDAQNDEFCKTCDRKEN